MDNARAFAQAGLAIIGGLVGIGGILGMVIAPILIGNGSGFAGGLAILFFGVHAIAGWMVAAIGLLIPQDPDHGIHFKPVLRWLLVWGLVGPVLGIGGYLIGIRVLPPLGDGLQAGAVLLLVIILVSGPIAVVTSLVRSTTVRQRARGLIGA